MTNPTKEKLQAAFDQGGGSRGISHQHINPFPVGPLADAWESGWQSADRELSGNGDG